MADLTSFVTNELAPAMNSHHIDRVMRYIDHNAVVKFPVPIPGVPAIVKGKGEIKKLLERFIDDVHVEPKDVKATGDRVEWKADITSDMFRRLGFAAFEGRVEATVRNNLIIEISPTIAPDALQRVQQVTQPPKSTNVKGGPLHPKPPVGQR